LLGDERKKIQSRESANPEAMVAYGLGQAELARRTEQSLIDATRYFEKALSLDTNYIDAYIGLGTAHSLMVSYGYGESEEFLPLGQDAINKAFAIDDKSGAAWASQGLLHMQKDDKQAAISALEKAMDYNPSHAMAVMWYAGLQEDINDRLRLYQKAFELDPRSPVIGYNVANNLLILGRESEAMQMFERIVEADPGYFGAYMLAARVNQSRGRVDEAINQYIKVYELSDSPDHAITIASMYSDLGDFEQSQMWLSKVKNDLPKSYEVYYDWQQFSSYASVDRLDEARPILLKKVTAATTTPDNSHFEDAALAAYFLGDFDTVIKYFEAIDDQATVDHFDNSNRIDAMLAAAYIYGLRGDQTKSEENLNKVENLIEQLTAKVPRIHGNIWYRKAQISAIRDDNRMALINLQRAIDEGWRGHWLTRIEPSLGSLRNEPAFQSMIAGLQTRMDIMREQLALASAFDSDWSG
jgi:tetratricopeptide (TPR) repeat protein